MMVETQPLLSPTEHRVGRLVEPKPMTIAELEALVRRGESDSVEFKKSTGQLTRAAETLCAFLNGHGGLALVGVSPDKKITGQIVADGTLQDVALLQTV